MAHYERLTALDASFLYLEDDNSHMHVAAALLFEPGPLQRPDGGLDMERIRAYVESRLEHIPRYRQRIAHIPVEGGPVWIDDPKFNLFYHVRHTSLPKPGSLRQLKRTCGRLVSQKLDRTKPLWEIWVIEGLEGGLFAVVTKVHHAMVDGVSGVDLLAVLLSPSPEESFEPPRPWRARPAPEGAALLGQEILRRTTAIGGAVSGLVQAFRDPASLVRESRDALEGLSETLSTGATPASETPLNELIGPHRRFDWHRQDLDQIKAVRRAFGGTLNDVVLATVAGAVRRFLGRRGLQVDDLDFRVMIPVSVRKASEHGALGNRVAQLIAPLPVAEADVVKRLETISETTKRLKSSHQAEASEWLEGLGDWTASNTLGQLVRAATLRRPFNLVVTNVPGPPMPLFLLGAPMQAPYPLVPLFVNQALGIALFSYCDGLYWGFNSDWDAVPDLHDFAEAIQESFTELHERAAAEAGPDPAARERHATSSGG